MCPNPSASNGTSSSDTIESTSTSTIPLDPLILSRLIDVHCHPIDSSRYRIEDNKEIRFKLSKVCCMSSTIDNQLKTKELWKLHKDRIIPCFGIHPWFTHHLSLISPAPTKLQHYSSLFPTSSTDSSLHPSLVSSLDLLPEPITLETFLTDIEKHLEDCGGTSFLGEVGIDGAFRIPVLKGGRSDPATVVGEDLSGRANLTPLTTPLSHQIEVAYEQIQLAIKLKKNISFHSVRSSKETLDLLSKLRDEAKGFQKINLCLHSFGGSPESAREVQRDHNNIYFSFSTAVSGRSPKFHELIKMIQPDRILLESDWCGIDKLDHQMMEVFNEVCLAKSWTSEECLSQMESNWIKFNSEPEIVIKRKSRKDR